MKNKREKSKISSEDLNRAVRKFVRDGGIIQKLPDQKSAGSKQVGGKWANTELGGEIY